MPSVCRFIRSQIILGNYDMHVLSLKSRNLKCMSLPMSKGIGRLDGDKIRRRCNLSHGAFSKIPLPITEPVPPLRRCISDPCAPTRAAFASQLPDSAIVHTPTEGRRLLAASSPSLPPNQPALRRSVSDPSPSSARGLSRAEESPSAKRLKRMQGRLKEMNHWMEEIVHDVDECMSTEEVPGPADRVQPESSVLLPRLLPKLFPFTFLTSFFLFWIDSGSNLRGMVKLKISRMNLLVLTRLEIASRFVSSALASKDSNFFSLVGMSTTSLSS